MSASPILRHGIVVCTLLGAVALVGCDRDQPDPGYPQQQQYPQQQYPQQQYPQPQAYPQPQGYPQPQPTAYPPQPTGAPPPATTAPPAGTGTPTAIPGLMKMPDGTCQAALPSLDPNATPQAPITIPCPPGV